MSVSHKKSETPKVSIEKDETVAYSTRDLSDADFAKMTPEQRYNAVLVYEHICNERAQEFINWYMDLSHPDYAPKGVESTKVNVGVGVRDLRCLVRTLIVMAGDTTWFFTATEALRLLASMEEMNALYLMKTGESPPEHALNLTQALKTCFVELININSDKVGDLMDYAEEDEYGRLVTNKTKAELKSRSGLH